ncbi:site-specific DNA-methyltransferase [Falcatimonas sp. MSJ-15]|uniref:site-specific DNA-methyltransferase n=1 Tax=Falcatimonas sp. MSJ-15 TaxID=2841515 RepID=UPI001C115422|nr:site-specific DNA-methyltransferase [Falcatimonas sp. MSJ-15]MBU5471591.1 site-specific DNA-methyltransferase [Falcatimonas sp. MSJ-15]
MQRLELTWIGKDEQPQVEPRILLHDPSKDYGDPNAQNMLIHGDNLLALKALEQQFAGQVKCIYIDPPYNTGAAFEHYDDNLEHSIWLKLMKARLEILRTLLAPEGSIFVQIDDVEYAYLKVIMDEIFGRNNYINTISVLMKNIAGASGGGEDKRLKKNIEYIVVYAKDYNLIKPFTPVYSYSPIAKLVQEYRDEGKSWKYTTALVDAGEKIYVGSTVDGDGNEIKIYKRVNYSIKPISALMREEKLSESEAYKKYATCLFQTAMPQSSIRPRVMEKVQEIGIESDLYSIEYVPKTGRNKGQLYEQFYKGSSFRLFAWLRDVAEERDGELYKKNLQGTYWDFVGETKNLTKEGSVEFPNGKKAERLISRILTMATAPGDLVFDSFLGSGTTAAVAHKMGRRYIGIELGNHCYTHCIPRLNSVIDGTDNGGITNDVNWQGGGGYKFYELAPTLIEKDKYGNPVFSSKYNSTMIAAAVAKINGFTYAPNKEVYWKQGYSQDNSFIYVTTQYLDSKMLDSIAEDVDSFENLLVCAPAFDNGLNKRYDNINVRKIPQSVLKKCEFGVDNYNLNIIDPPEIDEDEWEEDEEC